MFSSIVFRYVGSALITKGTYQDLLTFIRAAISPSTPTGTRSIPAFYRFPSRLYNDEDEELSLQAQGKLKRQRVRLSIIDQELRP